MLRLHEVFVQAHMHVVHLEGPNMTSSQVHLLEPEEPPLNHSVRLFRLPYTSFSSSESWLINQQ